MTAHPERNAQRLLLAAGALTVAAVVSLVWLLGIVAGTQSGTTGNGLGLATLAIVCGVLGHTAFFWGRAHATASTSLGPGEVFLALCPARRDGQRKLSKRFVFFVATTQRLNVFSLDWRGTARLDSLEYSAIERFAYDAGLNELQVAAGEKSYKAQPIQGGPRLIEEVRARAGHANSGPSSSSVS